MLVEGEKYACHACVRGHRVSKCRHANRPLLHINKKGRPSLKCANCQTIGKPHKRNVRCDCDGKKAHAEGDTEGAATHNLDYQAEDCCCSNTTRFASILRKEEVEPVTKDDHNDTSCSPAPGSGTPENCAVTTPFKDGEMGLTNGYHILMHKESDMGHRCGLTYVVRYTHSLTNDHTVSAGPEHGILKSDNGSAFLTSASDTDLMHNLLPPLNLSNFATNFTFPQHQEKSSPVPDDGQPMFTEALNSVSIDWFDYDGLGSKNEHSRAPSSTSLDFASSNQICSHENIDIREDSRGLEFWYPREVATTDLRTSVTNTPGNDIQETV